MANNEIYMDGIKVKISEKYKPPPRINLPMSYAQRLTLNKQIQDTMPNYEFLLEKSINGKLREWKEARSVMFNELKERVEKAREEFVKKSESVEEEKEEAAAAASSVTTTSNLFVANIPQYSNILTPIPLSATNNNFTCQANDKSPFNISDFEADTSSPFDNMELKTINDLEELAQVLRDDSQYQPQQSQVNYPTFTPTNTSSYIPSTQYLTNYPTTQRNGYYYPQDFKPYQYKIMDLSAAATTDDAKMSTCKSVPDIIKALRCELDNNTTHLDNNKRAKAISESTSKIIEKEEEEGVFKELPKNLQDLSKAISMMGFPLERVSRICKILGDDQKKIVEHLLAMSELLDLGFSEQRVSAALFQCDNDRDKALDLLIS